MNFRIYCTENQDEYEVEKIKESYVEYNNGIIKFYGFREKSRIMKIFENVTNEKDFLSRTVYLGIHRISIVYGDGK